MSTAHVNIVSPLACQHVPYRGCELAKGLMLVKAYCGSLPVLVLPIAFDADDAVTVIDDHRWAVCRHGDAMIGVVVSTSAP